MRSGHRDLDCPLDLLLASSTSREINISRLWLVLLEFSGDHHQVFRAG